MMSLDLFTTLSASSVQPESGVEVFHYEPSHTEEGPQHFAVSPFSPSAHEIHDLEFVEAAGVFFISLVVIVVGVIQKRRHHRPRPP